MEVYEKQKKRRIERAKGQVSDGGRTRKDLRMLHEWRLEWRAWMRKKKMLVRELNAEYQRRARQIYEAVRRANEDNWERLREMVDVESPDLRKQGQLYKELKKMFPDKNYTKYNKEEKERLKDWKTKLTKEELEQHNKNKNQQE